MDIFSDEYACQKDSEDTLNKLRNEFMIPTRGQLKRTTLNSSAEPVKKTDVQQSTYLCGNSLGLQPKLTAQYTAAYHETWATKGVYGHFKEVEDSPLVPWLHVDDDAAADMAAVVGARKEEVAVMQTLTANLHLAMASFYRPTKERYKIIIESKAFPSDHYAIESQIRHHNLLPSEAMITIEPSSRDTPTLTTSHILSTIDEHASSTAVLLLPGIQFYTGQFFDIPTITAHAQKYGIAVGWDLAHAAGNAVLQLHDWNVDFAVWCTYKYLNCGPGSIGGLFIHDRHTSVSAPSTNSQADTSPATKSNGTDNGTADAGPTYRPRLSGWWGSSKTSRFNMTNTFEPLPGAGGWQLSNPSVADLTAVRASLDVFKQTSMHDLHAKSLKLTGYLEELLDRAAAETGGPALWNIITPREPEARGAQLSVRLADGLLDGVMGVLEEEGVVVDERRPDVVRVAPAPLYNSFADVLRFVKVFSRACREVRERGSSGDKEGGVMVQGGKEDRGWAEIK